MKKCELLAPSGSYDAFVAAIEAGADAVYMGAHRHNARRGAKNFTEEELSLAIREAHLYGKKVYITLNTLIGDREFEEALDLAGDLYSMGADALIVQDLGLIAALREAFPHGEIHASTQCVTHSLEQIKALHRLGVSRAVVARELSREDLGLICRESPVEIEAFVHGALCVCHSGACLFSSLVGGRSGNRGECAQPCRLPYSLGGLNERYPLSLRDLSLSTQLQGLVKMGVSSLKIEGRMKSPDYVYGVVSVFRSLLDQCRDANDEDIERLDKIFSRDGFTDGYFKRKLGKNMFGIRREEDKEKTREADKRSYSLPKIPIEARLDVTCDAALLTLKKDGISATAKSEAPSPATSLPISRESALEQISKMGETPFKIESFDFFADGDYFLKKSTLNLLRREAAEGLVNAVLPKTEPLKREKITEPEEAFSSVSENIVIFSPHRKITKKEYDALSSSDIQRIYLPMFRFPDFKVDEGRIGLVLPMVVTDSQREEFERELDRLWDAGIREAFGDNLGVSLIAMNKGFKVLGGGRLNAYNSRTVTELKRLGFKGIILSHELTAGARRHIVKSLPSGEVIYGRVPLMIMENCTFNLRDNCRERCDWRSCSKTGRLTDRRGVEFPVFPEYFHRAQIFNSTPTSKESHLNYRVIIITDESDVKKCVENALLFNDPSEFTRKG